MATSKPTDEWYTPPEIIEPAAKVLGRFFDPYGEPGTPAASLATDRFEYPEEDALVDEWPDLPAYVNFPYSKVEPHVNALLRNAPSAWLVVCNSSTSARWFQRLLGASDYVCFPAARIRFLRRPNLEVNPKEDPDEERARVDAERTEADASPWGLVQPGSPRYNNAIFYRGDRTADFAAEFSKLGQVL